MDEDDTIRCDLEGYDVDYIEDVLLGFMEGAPAHGRRLSEIRVTEVMLNRLRLEHRESGTFFQGVPVVVTDTGFDGTIEVELSPTH
jgi:hypothetical protein